MNSVIYAFTDKGKALALRIADLLSEDGASSASCRVPYRLADDSCAAYGGDLTASVGEAFHCDALIFVGACGIALRAVAPHVASKLSDPAVICVDEGARFVIPLLSGHIGGANRLARRLAGALCAEPVITTATDVNGRFSVDEWAAEHGMHISDMVLAKRISAAILTRDIPICADHPLPDALPDGLISAVAGDLGICISIRRRKPFGDTLLLSPRALRVGLGCRRGTSRSTIAAAVERVFDVNDLSFEAVACAASIDVKADEFGLLDYCRERKWPLRFYSAPELEAVPGRFEESAFVKNTVGVGNVCERAALIGGGTLIVPKTALDGVTVAVGEMEWGIELGGN